MCDNHMHVKSNYKENIGCPRSFVCDIYLIISFVYQSCQTGGFPSDKKKRGSVFSPCATSHIGNSLWITSVCLSDIMLTFFFKVPFSYND